MRITEVGSGRDKMTVVSRDKMSTRASSWQSGRLHLSCGREMGFVAVGAPCLTVGAEAEIRGHVEPIPVEPIPKDYRSPCSADHEQVVVGQHYGVHLPVPTVGWGQAAMARLVVGTDKREHIVPLGENIAKERGKSHATRYRFPEVVQDVQRELARMRAEPEPTPPKEEVRRAKAEVADLKASLGARVRETEAENDRLAQSVQYLTLKLGRAASARAAGLAGAPAIRMACGCWPRQ